MARRFAGPVRLLLLALLLLLVTCDGALLNRPKRKPNAQRDYGLLGNLVVKGLDTAFGIMRNATAPSGAVPCQNMTELKAAGGHGTASVNVTAEAELESSKPQMLVGKRRSKPLPPCPENNADASTAANNTAKEEELEPEPGPVQEQPKAPVARSVLDEAPPPAPRYKMMADRFRKLVEPFLLNFRSPEEHITEALTRLKGLEAKERMHNPRYIGGFSEL